MWERERERDCYLNYCGVCYSIVNVSYSWQYCLVAIFLAHPRDEVSQGLLWSLCVRLLTFALKAYSLSQLSYSIETSHEWSLGDSLPKLL